MRILSRPLRTIAILLAVIIALTVAVGQIFKSVVNYEDTVSAVVFSRDIPKGELIKAGDAALYMATATVPRAALPPTAVTSMALSEDMYISEDVVKGEYVVSHTLTKEYPNRVSYDIPDGYSLVSVQFERADAANAWNVFAGQEVTLVYTPNTMVNNESNSKYLTECLISATVYSLKDAQYYVQGEPEYNPAKLLYITFLVIEEDAIFIAHIKDKGRLNIIQ